MKRKIILFTILLTLLMNICVTSNAKTKAPDLDADSAIMYDLITEKILFQKNKDKQIEPGGLVKIMTAIVAIEHIKDVSKSVTADVNTLSSYDYSFGHMGILANEKIDYDSLLHGMLLYDAGDAAEVIAATVMNSRESFIKEMNNKAVELGALNTKFTNPTGFPDKKQYSTVEDLYTITKYAMSNSYFAEIVGKSRYEMAPTNKYTQHRYLDNKNKYMNVSTTDKYFTSKAKGVKTSYINDKSCGLIVQYENDSMHLMTIVSGASYDGTTNYAYEDTSKLIDYGLNYYTSVKVITEDEIFEEVELMNGRGVDRILLSAKEDVYINLPEDYDEELLKVKVTLVPDIKAPIKKGQKLGVVEVFYNNERYISTELTSQYEIKSNFFKGVFKRLWLILTSPVLLVSMGILLIIVVWSILIFNKRKSYKFNKK